MKMGLDVVLLDWTGSAYDICSLHMCSRQTLEAAEIADQPRPVQQDHGRAKLHAAAADLQALHGDGPGRGLVGLAWVSLQLRQSATVWQT